jgi:hypothetical protein
MKGFRRTFAVKVAELGDYAIATGAAAWAKDRVAGK